MARPKKIIDAGRAIQKLAAIGCTNVEIADALGYSPTHVARYVDELTKGRAEKRIRLRRLQWQAAERLNPTMLIWLGKAYLDQVERPNVEPSVDFERLAAIGELMRSHGGAGRVGSEGT